VGVQLRTGEKILRRVPPGSGVPRNPHRGNRGLLLCGGRPENDAVHRAEREPDHRGNANRIAFRADSEEEVNRLGAIIRQAGAHHVEGPEYCHDYTPGYYAVFFRGCRRQQMGDLLPQRPRALKPRPCTPGSTLPSPSPPCGTLY